MRDDAERLADLYEAYQSAGLHVSLLMERAENTDFDSFEDMQDASYEIMEAETDWVLIGDEILALGGDLP